MRSLFAVLFVTLVRAIPHFPNLAPMGAVAIVSGRTLSKKMALLTTLAALIVSDLVLSQMYGYPFLGFISLFVYGAFILQMFLGRWLRQKKGGSFIAAFVGACLFYLISNFGVWMQGFMYPPTLEGLFQCYLMALPFFKMTLLGNMIWTPVLCLGHRLYEMRSAKAAYASPAL